MDAAKVIISPIISEKSYALAAEDKYVFRVHDDAHKTEIRQAAEELFDVSVLGVQTINMKSKPKRRGLIKGRTKSWKKAIVKIKAGESIPIFQGLTGGDS